jgi:hypothetical protein
VTLPFARCSTSPASDEYRPRFGCICGQNAAAG